MVESEKKLENFPTRASPQIKINLVKVPFPRAFINIKQVSIDEIDSFSKVRGVDCAVNPALVYEKDIKGGLKNIFGEKGAFTDWGGETDDLFSTRAIIKGKRMSVAFGLKGRGTKGKLTPKKMGKNGDQIQRLFKSPADLFVVQYHGQIDESVIDLMKSMAIAKSAMENRKIYFGIIDGGDTSRLLTAYSKYFN